MGNPAGVRRDFEKLEERRRLGARLLRQGVHQAEVARQVGVHRQSVSRWAHNWQQGGVRALKKAGHAGRKPRLQPEDLRRIEKRTEARAASLGIRNQSVDFVARGPPDRAGMRGEVSPIASLADSAATGLELPASGRTGAGTGRSQDPAVETEALAGD